MRHLDVTHKILGIMANLIAIYVFASRVMPVLQPPARWTDLLLPVATLLFVAVTFYRDHQSKAEKARELSVVRRASISQEPSPALVLAPSDLAIPIKTQAELESLSFAQTVALRLVYENPGIFFGELCQRLHLLGFRGTGELIAQPLIETSLVHLENARSTLSPNPNPVIAKAVREFIAKRPLHL